MDKYIKSLQGKVVANGDGFYIDGDDWDNLISKLRAAGDLLEEGASIIKYNGTGEEDEICYISEVGLFLEG